MVLHSGLSGPRNPALAFNGHRRKRWSDRGVARKRRRDRASESGVVSWCVLASHQGPASEGLSRLAAFGFPLRQGRVVAP
jgi:hypothetical protein